MLKHAIIFIGICGSALAGGLEDRLPPNSWLEEYRPEKLPKLKYPSYYKDLDKARHEAFTGRYKQALISLAKVPDAPAADAAQIRITCLHALGRSYAALQLDLPDARVQVLRAQVLADLGGHDEAIGILEAQIKDHPESISARFWHTNLLERKGDIDGAKSALAWFNAPPRNFLDTLKDGGELPIEDAAELTLVARALDRLAVFTGAYEGNENLHTAMLNLFVRAYDVLDRQHWPAHVAAAEYCLAHNDDVKANEELKAAASINPNDPRIYELFGTVAINHYNFDGCDAVLDAMRLTNPTSHPADLLEARSLLQQRRPAEAESILTRALQRQPKNTETIGLLAAAAALRLNDARLAELITLADQIDPGNASVYHEVASQLGAMRQYPRAAGMFKTAIERAPWWTAPRNALGLLYTQSGDEDLARATLEAAHAMDPFNLETTNYLRLLDDLDKFARHETEHFIVIYDAERDPLIPEYFAEYLESIHAEVCKAFAHEPTVKTMIEVFPTHDAFSVRTTGSPWIGTVGASTGRVIALVSPRKGEATMGAFNWAAVLRHEYTHTVTLSATDNRIAHWMTEGLAVWQEEAPIRWEWVPMLYHAVKNDELFTLDSITWGFVRPKRPMDRQLAYAQSYWICKYIIDTWGKDSMLKMLEMFRAGKDQNEVFPAVLGKSTTQFDSEFRKWTENQIAAWGYGEDATAEYDSLRELGEKYIKEKKYEPAINAWNEIIKLRPMDELPHKRLAGIYLTKQINQPEKAIEHLQTLAEMEAKDNRFAKRVARLYRDLNKLNEAKQSAKLAVYTDPYDLDAHKLLAELCEASGDKQGLQKETRVIAELEKWIQANRARSAIGN